MLVSFVLEDLLLEVQKGLFVVHMLPHLHHTLPFVRGVEFLAIRALEIFFVKLDNGGLRELSCVVDILGNC